jgi:hypothetical protein
MKHNTDRPPNIRFKTEGIFIVAAIILFGGVIGWKIIFEVSMPELYISCLAIISLLLNAVSSAYTIYYKEIPRSGNLPSIKGRWAVFWGSGSLIISIVAALVLILEILKSTAFGE